MQTATAFSNRNKMNPYLVNEISNATPAQQIMKVYDFAIMKCQKEDMLKTNEAIQVLIDCLNFTDESAKPISIGLLRLYQYCQDQMRKKNYKEVQKILSELRVTWQDALKLR
ncbi:MAG: flagellar protein FliS [Ignavibacteriales bacterium]|nr:flagellar protein FliS [Ignavibacteriales bacterium]